MIANELVDSGQLLDRDRVGQRVGSGAAPLLGDAGCPSGRARRRRPPVPAETAPLAVELLGHRRRSLPLQTREPSPGRAAARRRGRSSAQRLGQLHQQSHAEAGAALGELIATRAGQVGGAGDVEVRPRPVAGELRQEARGVSGPRHAGLDELAMSAMSERMKRRNVSCSGSCHRWSPERSPAATSWSIHSWSRPISAGVEVAQRRPPRPGQGRQVDQVGRAQRARVVQAVGQHQPPLGVGVGDLDRLAVGCGDDVVDLDRVLASTMFSLAPTTVMTLMRQPQLGDRRGRLEHRGGARHVVLHAHHAAGGLHRQPPMSNVTPLPTRPSTTSRRRARAGRCASAISRAGEPFACASRGERAHPVGSRSSAGRAPGRDGTVLAGDRPGPVGQLGRPHVAGPECSAGRGRG